MKKDIFRTVILAISLVVNALFIAVIMVYILTPFLDALVKGVSIDNGRYCEFLEKELPNFYGSEEESWCKNCSIGWNN